jgi:RIO kinase 1
MFQKAQLVHGDLSEYNIMVSENQPVLIDVSQAVSLEHPMAGLMLKRDLSNLNRYFRSLGVDVIPENVLQARVMGKHAD